MYYRHRRNELATETSEEIIMDTRSVREIAFVDIPLSAITG